MLATQSLAGSPNKRILCATQDIQRPNVFVPQCPIHLGPSLTRQKMNILTVSIRPLGPVLHEQPADSFSLVARVNTNRIESYLFLKFH